MRLVEFLIDDTNSTGVKTISLVDSPAMESDFISFSNEKPKPKHLSLETEEEGYKQVVAGLSMIPDKLIYRIDQETGEEYNGYFSQDTIEQIRDKYHKEMMTSNVNLDHDDNAYIDAFLIESYILSTEARVEEVKAQGIEEATLGAWYTQFKIEDPEIFQKVLDGEFNGFSIEGYLNKEIKASLKNKFKEKEKKMKTNLIDKFKAFLETLEAEETQVDEALESALVPELDITISWGDVEAEVTKTYTNEEDEEVTEPVGQGEFILEDGRIVVVDENSMLIEVQDAPTEEPVVEEETVVEEEASAEPVAEIPSEEVVETEVKAEEEVVAEEEEVVAEETGMPAEVITWLNSIAGNFDDGDIYLSFYKTGGDFAYGSVSTYANIAMTKENMAKIAELEEKMSEPAAEPKLTDETITSGEAKELTVYETVMKRKGLA